MAPQTPRSDWGQEFARWVAPLLEALGHKARRRWAPLYLLGLLGPGERKSVQPMAARPIDPRAAAGPLAPGRAAPARRARRGRALSALPHARRLHPPRMKVAK
jgi:SRSO17 transposase